MCKIALYIWWYCNISELVNSYFTDTVMQCAIKSHATFPFRIGFEELIFMGSWYTCGGRELIFSFCQNIC